MTGALTYGLALVTLVASPAFLVAGPGLAPTAIANPYVPNTGVDVDKLAPDNVEHHTVLRIDTDIRRDGYDIVIDGWEEHDDLEEVRIWWLNPKKGNQRSPFGSGVTRYVTIGYDRLDADGWRVRLQARKKQYAFAIHLQGSQAVAYADIDTASGPVDGCRVDQSKLVAKKFLGLPTGLDKITISCTDAEGNAHSGVLRAKKLK